MPCPVCYSIHKRLVFENPTASPFQNFLFESEENAVSVFSLRFSYMQCGDCGHVYNPDYNQDLYNYENHYVNAQQTSPEFSTHALERVSKINTTIAGFGAFDVIEIGCGQGDFLKAFGESAAGARAASMRGYDQAFDGRDLGPNIQAAGIALDEALASSLRASADVVICRHVLEHIPAPRAFMARLAGCLRDDRSVAFIEIRNAEHLLRRSEPNLFFPEQCGVFGFSSIAKLLFDAGLEMFAVEECLGGEYLWIEARRTVRSGAALTFPVSDIRGKLSELEGEIWVWGAGAKGATFVQSVDRDRALLSGLIDINPEKQGQYIATSGHRIYSPDVLKARPGSVIVVNNAYFDEVSKLCFGMDQDIRVLKALF